MEKITMPPKSPFIAPLGEIPSTGDIPFLLDSGIILAVSVAICTLSDRLLAMTILIPLILFLRFLLWAFLSAEEKPLGWKREGILFMICLALGAFNDWNSVDMHKIYAYKVPQYFPTVSTIPIWMLLYWGMILRYLISFFTWKRLSPPLVCNNTLSLGKKKIHHPLLKVAILLVLVAVTRQCIYRFYLDPLLSWIPFACAMALYCLLFPLSLHDGKILAIFALGGPGIEIIYIQIGNLHQYHLGWLAGVPLWIALWWLLVVLIWKDFSGRILVYFIKGS